MKYNKNRNPLLNLLINCIPARSVPQILPIKDYCNFSFSNVVIIGLCNLSVNCWFGIFSLLTADLSLAAKVSDRARVTALPEEFLSKKL